MFAVDTALNYVSHNRGNSQNSNTYHGANVIPTQVELNQRVKACEVLDVFNYITSEVKNTQISEMLKTFNVLDLGITMSNRNFKNKLSDNATTIDCKTLCRCNDIHSSEQ